MLKNYNKLENKKEYLIKNIPKLVKKFDYKKGPALYFYKRVIGEIRKNKLADLFNKKEFIELLYAILVAWDMNARGAKMKYFDNFRKNILANKKYFLSLSKYKLDTMSEKEFSNDVKELLGILYDRLSLMQTKSKLVSNSKLMHYLLPDLIMPIDGQNTLSFLFGNTGESKKKFLEIIECTRCIVNKLSLSRFLDNEWNVSVPKVIDNAIICEKSLKYRK